MDALQYWFKRWGGRLERKLFGAAIVFLALLVLSQLLMSNNMLRSHLNKLERYEGKPYVWQEETKEPVAGLD